MFPISVPTTHNTDSILIANWFRPYLIVNCHQINDKFYVLSSRMRAQYHSNCRKTHYGWPNHYMHCILHWSLTALHDLLFTQYYLSMQAVALTDVRVNSIGKCSEWKVYCMILTRWLFVWSYCPVLWYKSRHNVSIMIKCVFVRLFISNLLIIPRCPLRIYILVNFLRWIHSYRFLSINEWEDYQNCVCVM